SARHHDNDAAAICSASKNVGATREHSQAILVFGPWSVVMSPPTGTRERRHAGRNTDTGAYAEPVLYACLRSRDVRGAGRAAVEGAATRRDHTRMVAPARIPAVSLAKAAHHLAGRARRRIRTTVD